MKGISRNEIMKRRWKDPKFRAEMSRKAKLNWKKGITTVSFKGQKHNESAKKEMSKKREEYFEQSEHRENMKRKNLGRKESTETRHKKSESMKKVWQDEEWATKRIAGIIALARSPEMRIKMSKASRGRVVSEYTKKLVSKKIKEKWQTREYRDKMLKANCSDKMRKIRRKNSVGKNNPMYGRAKDLAPNWRGGISKEPYAFEFNDRLKRRIKKRDNYICQNCGEKKYLHIHHIDYNKKNFDEHNLITLCRRCNARANFNRSFWTEKFREMIII